MDKLRKIFAVAMICLVVSTIAVYALSRLYPMTAPVQPIPTLLYKDAECTQEITTAGFDWTDQVYNGKVLTVYVKNTGLSPASVTASIQSSTNCTITIAPTTAFVLNPSAVQAVTMTFTITVPNAVAVSWNLKLDS